MYDQNAATMHRYLDQLVEGGDFADIPMRDDIRFTGPLASSTTAVEYRSICQGFADAVRAMSIRTMVGDDDVIHVVYCRCGAAHHDPTPVRTRCRSPHRV